MNTKKNIKLMKFKINLINYFKILIQLLEDMVCIGFLTMLDNAFFQIMTMNMTIIWAY